jgi:hypothetical protein
MFEHSVPFGFLPVLTILAVFLVRVKLFFGQTADAALQARIRVVHDADTTCGAPRITAELNDGSLTRSG